MARQVLQGTSEITSEGMAVHIHELHAAASVILHTSVSQAATPPPAAPVPKPNSYALLKLALGSMGRLLDERMPQRILGCNALIRVEVHHTLQEIRQLRHFAAVAFCIGQQCRKVLLDARVADQSPCLQSIILCTLSDLYKLKVGALPAKITHAMHVSF